MEEQFVTYEIALKLKELGFDEPCLAYINIKYNGLTENYYGELILGKDPDYLTCQHKMHYIFGQQICLAPLWQQVIDWFREKHNLYINIEPKITKEWEFSIFKLNDGLLFGSKSLYIKKDINYYKVREASILKAIELCQKEK